MLINHAKEIIKCAESYEYFHENYAKVFHPLYGFKTIFYPWQKRLGKELNENQFVISVKWRNSGIATTHLIYCLWLCLFKENKQIYWVEPRHEEAEEIAKFFYSIYLMLPEWMQDQFERNSKTIKQFKNTKSEIRFGISEKIHHKKLTHIVINDAAYIHDFEWKWKMMWSSLTESKCYITSAAKEDYSWFLETYQHAIHNRNKFHVFESHYTEHPDYQNPEYVKAIKENLGEIGWLTEVEGNFRLKDQKLN